MRDDFQFFTVKVASGSGCLFQPLDSEYSYVLTAKHVIEGVENIEIVRQYIGKDGNKIDETLEILEIPYIHSNPNKDAAIIKIKKIDGIESLLRSDLSKIEKENWYLCGHPDSRENNGFSYRKNKLKIENPVELYIEGEIERNVNHSEIVGQSGGGIVKSESSCFLLAGIQKKMAVEDEEETLSRIHFAPLSFFDEIIEENKANLSPLFPPYIGTFNILLQEIFPFPNLIVKQELVRSTLLAISESICGGTSPDKIIKEYGQKFLVNGTPTHIIYHKSLWKSLLEFLTIIKLYEETTDLDNLTNIHKKRKMLIVDTNNWTKKLEEIYKSDLSEIEKGGSIVICATNESVPSRTEISAEELRVITDISTPLDKMNISNTVEDPFSDLKLVNIFKFQHHIINNVMQLANINGVNSKTTIKELTDGII
ncbi:ABC-three component system protein [Moheibacter lacus]|uniref:Trypsin-like peptidase domain-containing protein n=1 Tax=Moheibacter lacus TaxID=2745851 RepID=A0A838ZTS3_9FLAO|nr:ABC-three component system protein [Moheibacter lacus]MBA5630388.1 trypsin-like peptidase domain-containing protein [Moheibacter lacus]